MPRRINAGRSRAQSPQQRDLALPPISLAVISFRRRNTQADERMVLNAVYLFSGKEYNTRSFGKNRRRNRGVPRQVVASPAGRAPSFGDHKLWLRETTNVARKTENSSPHLPAPAHASADQARGNQARRQGGQQSGQSGTQAFRAGPAAHRSFRRKTARRPTDQEKSQGGEEPHQVDDQCPAARTPWWRYGTARYGTGRRQSAPKPGPRRPPGSACEKAHRCPESCSRMGICTHREVRTCACIPTKRPRAVKSWKFQLLTARASTTVRDKRTEQCRKHAQTRSERLRREVRDALAHLLQERHSLIKAAVARRAGGPPGVSPQPHGSGTDHRRGDAHAYRHTSARCGWFSSARPRECCAPPTAGERETVRGAPVVLARP